MAAAQNSQPGEGMPLLPSTSHRQVVPSGRLAVPIDFEDEDSMTEEEEEDGDQNEDAVFADGRRRTTSLIPYDSILLVLNALQVYALLQSLALRWPWPSPWVTNLRFIFWANLDIWEFMKLQNNNTYKSIQGHFTPSSAVGIQYWYILAAWAALLLIALLCHLVAYAVITYRHRATMLIELARLQRTYLSFAQIFAIPLGIIIARLFHCTDTGVVDVANELTCFDGYHWAYVAPSLVVVLLFFIAIPIWLILRTKAEMLDMTKDRHEGYIQLKEAEYIQGLDILWVVGSFHVFSSFKKRGAHLRATLHILLAFVLSIYAGLFQLMFIQILILTLLLFAMLIAFIAIRPYRVMAFNLYLITNYLCLVGNALLGCLQLTYTPATLASPWLSPTYLIILLAIINVTWLVVTLIFLIYLLTYQCACCSKCHPHPLWPSMMFDGLKRVSPQTHKYIHAILHSRIVAEKCLSMPALLAPAHELARQIHIINAYCREAEHTRDTLHNTLWDTLDELVEAHGQVAPRSLFAESVKDSIRQTATELLGHLPGFVRRLAQREYDFLLVNPVKRRMLLKMYCMGLFLNGRRDHIERERVTIPAVQKVWTRTEQDDGYFEDMYPEPDPGATLRPDTVVSLDLFSPAAIDDELAIEEAEQWTKMHPMSRGMPNLAFEDDISLLEESVHSSRLSVPGNAFPENADKGHTNATERLGSAQSLLPPGEQSSQNSGLEPAVPPGGQTGRPVSATGSLGALSRSRHDTEVATRAASGLLSRPGSGQNPGDPARSSSVQLSRPTSGQSLRPGSAVSQRRPQSASSGVGEALRHSPLPGQVDDLEDEPDPGL